MQPIAATAWSPAIDAESQDDWDIRVGSAISKTNIIQAGNSNSAPPTWGAAELIATENSTAKQYVYDYAHHNYPGGTLTALMSHSGIVTNMNQFTADIAAASTTGKDYVLGETNSGIHPSPPKLHRTSRTIINTTQYLVAEQQQSALSSEQHSGQWTTSSAPRFST